MLLGHYREYFYFGLKSVSSAFHMIPIALFQSRLLTVLLIKLRKVHKYDRKEEGHIVWLCIDNDQHNGQRNHANQILPKNRKQPLIIITRYRIPGTPAAEITTSPT